MGEWDVSVLHHLEVVCKKTIFYLLILFSIEIPTTLHNVVHSSAAKVMSNLQCDYR